MSNLFISKNNNITELYNSYDINKGLKVLHTC